MHARVQGNNVTRGKERWPYGAVALNKMPIVARWPMGDAPCGAVALWVGVLCGFGACVG